MVYVPEQPVPFATATVMPVPARDYYPYQKPIALPGVALGWNSESDTNIENGRFLAHTGEVEGDANLLLQDTYYAGASGSFIGTSFDSSAASGVTFVMDKVGNYDTWGILIPQNKIYTLSSLTETAPRGSFGNFDVLLTRGIPTGTLTPATWFTYLYLNWGGYRDYRLAFLYNRPIRFETTIDKWVHSHVEDNFNKLGNSEQYLKEREFHCRIRTDRKKGSIHIEVGTGNTITYKPSNALFGPLPTTGRMRLEVASGHALFQVFPLRFGAAKISRQVKVSQATVSSALDNAFIVPNALSKDSNTNVTTTVTGIEDNRISYEMNATQPDNGEGIGSFDPPKLTDGTLIIPAVWVTGIPGGVNNNAPVGLRLMQVQETNIWDDIRRTTMTSGNLILNNYDGLYSGAFARKALNLSASNDNGANMFTRLSGVCGQGDGFTAMNDGGVYRMAVPFSDNLAKMQSGVGTDCMFDGWYIGSVIRYLLERGNVHWATHGNTFTPPLYIPPGATITDPYGPAGDDIDETYIVLGSGYGNKPRYEFSPEMTPWDILSTLIVDMSDSMGRPYYMGFDQNGQFNFLPYDPRVLPLSCCYSTVPVGSVLNTYFPSVPFLKIIDSLHVRNSTESMRSELTFQGLDALSFELMNAHFEQPPWVKEALGWPQEWIERNARWSGEDYLNYLVTVSAGKASLPTQIVVFQAMFAPWLYAGQKIAVEDPKQLGGFNYYQVLNISSVYGAGDLYGGSVTAHHSTIIARWVENF
jgi:hypothetical protein